MGSIQILTFEGHKVPDEYRQNVRLLLEGAFDDDDAIELPPETYHAVLALDGHDKVMGHLAAYVRVVDFESGRQPLGMIGDVVTSVSFQRQGIAKKMIEAAHGLFRRLGVNYSILFAYDPAVYSSSGYELMRNEVHFLDEDGTWKTFVYRGGMFCELSDQRWSTGLIDLNGRAV